MTEPIERHEMLEVEQAWSMNFSVENSRGPDAAERINFLRGLVVEFQREADEASSRAGPEGGHLDEARLLVEQAAHFLDEGRNDHATLSLHMAQVHAAIALAENVNV